jgi:aryl-alcohol dehydrogenase-like predicted oxidoreductase
MRTFVLLLALAAAAAAQGLQEACASFSAPRVVIGCWQILERHADEKEGIRTLKAYAERGFTTFDTADIYGRSEAVLGQLRASGINPVIHTKFVTRDSDFDAAQQVNTRSAQALGAAPDLVAFHWW